jgi:hypothetical protein
MLFRSTVSRPQKKRSELEIEREMQSVSHLVSVIGSVRPLAETRKCGGQSSRNLATSSPAIATSRENHRYIYSGVDTQDCEFE